MWNWTSTLGWTCHWKTCGALGFSTDKSLIYCASIETWASSLGSPEPLPPLVGSWSAIHPVLVKLGVCREPRLAAARWGRRLAAAQMGRNGTIVRWSVLEYSARSHYVALKDRSRIASLTVIVILALVALFIGL